MKKIYQRIDTCRRSGVGLFLLLSISFIILQTGLATGQQAGRVTGKVTDEGGAPVIGAAVVVKDGTTGTTTDKDGLFSLVVSPNTTLVVSFMGFISAELNTESRTNIQVVLKEDVNTLDEVIVVGYGTQRRGDLTGAIASVRGDDIPKTGNTTLAQALKGQIAGITFDQTSNQPGARVEINIRGKATDASPLIVIDGIPIQPMYNLDSDDKYKLDYRVGSKEYVLDDINPDDIQDIQVLKDASATSIYGSNAAGGVILITTKRGSQGRTDVTFRSSYTSQWIAKRPEVLNAKEYMREVNSYQLQQYVYDNYYYPWGDRPLPTEADLLAEFMAANAGQPNRGFIFDPAAIDLYPGNGTDWYDEVTRRGQIQQYDLSVNGGNEKTTFRISLGRMQNDGIVKKNNYARTSGRVNLDHKFNNWINAGLSASYSFLRSSDVALEGSSGTTVLLAAARGFDPTVPAYDMNGNLSASTLSPGVTTNNPLSILDATLQSKKDNLLTSAYVEFKPVKDLSILTTFGYDRKFQTNNSYFASTTKQGNDYDGVAQIRRADLANYYTNIRATYSTVFADDHSLSVMAGWEYQKQENESLAGWNTGFPYDGVMWNNLELGTNERPKVYSTKDSGETASILARLNYAFKGKYLLTANFRRDGSSNFAPNKQWGNFGGVALGWRISDESWLRDVDWLYNLKLRAGYGVTGYAGSLTGTLTYYKAGYGYYFNNTPTSGIRLEVLGNPDLSWESQYDLNSGLDFGFFNNRLGGSIDVYERTIKNRIDEKDLMSYQEVKKIHYNTQRIDKTTGVDLSIYAIPVNKQGFQWSTQFTLTFYRDKTTRRDPSEVMEINQFHKYTWNDMWYHLSDGLLKPGEVNPGQQVTDRRAGEVKIKDVNGYLRDEYGNKVYDADGRPIYSGMPDGVIDEADKVKLGNRTPIPFSWNNTFRWKNFDLGIYIYGKLHTWKGNDKMSNINPETLLSGGNTLRGVVNRYSYNNLESTQPSFRYWQHGGVGYGDYFMERSWFIRLDNISLGYTLPRRLTQGVLQSVRFYGSIKNVATISPFKGYDPEFDVFLYPSTSSFTFGIDIKF